MRIRRVAPKRTWARFLVGLIFGLSVGYGIGFITGFDFAEYLMADDPTVETIGNDA